MVHIFRTPTPKAGRSVTFASSPVKSDGRLLGPTNLKSTVGQYSRTDHTNTVMVARLAPPVQGSTVEEKYSSNVSSDHWSNLPTAVKNLRLTANIFPRLTSDSPATDLNSPLKPTELFKSAMKNSLPPSLAPRASRSASKGDNPDAFDANVDYPAELGASPVPPDTPTHPALYKGALAYGSPKKSMLPSRVRYIPSPTTTPDDDQDLPNNKKKRRTSEKGPAYFDVCKLTYDDIDDIIEEDRNLHPDKRKQQAFAAPPQQDTKVSHRATSTTKKAAKMQTTTTTTTMDNYNNKMGATTNKNGPTTLPAASTNVMSNNIGPTDVFTTKEHTTTAAKRRTNPNKNNITDLTDDANDSETPQKAPNSPPTLTYKSRANTPSIPTAKVTTLTNFAQPAHHPIFQAPVCMNPSGFTTLQKTCKDLHDCLFAHLFNLPFHPSPSRYHPPVRKQ